MQLRFFALLFSFLFTVSGIASTHKPPHLDLDASSSELRAALKIRSKSVLSKTVGKETSIDTALKLGERLLAWVDLINQSRADKDKIYLSSPETRHGIPITAPNHYSPRSVETDMNSARTQMPEAMRNILFSDVLLPNTNPISDIDFSKYGRLVDRVYQTAARWQMLIPYKSYFIANQKDDIRGYYYLKTNNWDMISLQNWQNIPVETQNSIREAFIGICMNSRVAYAKCKTRADAVDNSAKAVNYYQSYMSGSEQIYNGFFQLSNARRDINWNAKDSAIAAIPFVDPARADVQHFIKHNIEDEFSWQGWNLKINFVAKRPAPYIVFIPGVTANVESLGGNKIEMDANKSLNEYEEQWTIRHEFGHVLGLPDCYHEFYDDVNEEFINYQIDITDLMCSRAGNMSQRIYDQLKNTYMK